MADLNRTNPKGIAAAGIFSFLFSILASSHHWLHMGVLLLLGGSANMMSTMSTMLWLRRLMIAATLITVIISLYRLYVHRCKSLWVLISVALSTVLSLGFLVYTLVQFGW
ncbi:MAG: hypothetical protein K0S39_3860 [Paenibacillus sp.]|nr:hypothetical protein [Paenibacillus sp.]